MIGNTFDYIKFNHKYKIDSLELLKKFKESFFKICFFDPQYRGLLDKMKYGNEKEGKSKSRALLPQMEEGQIMEIIKEIDRVLLPSGHLFFWIDKFQFAEGSFKSYLNHTDLVVVDWMTWNKKRMGMGYRTRRQTEQLIIIQKLPKRAKGVWKIKNIPDIWEEKIVDKKHPHQKPFNLIKELILSTSDESDFVLDPCAGSFVVFDACKETKRNFIGTDIVYGE